MVTAGVSLLLITALLNILAFYCRVLKVYVLNVNQQAYHGFSLVQSCDLLYEIFCCCATSLRGNHPINVPLHGWGVCE